MTTLNEKEKTLDCLRAGNLTLEGQFMWGSNYTFLCQLECGEQLLRAVYKPTHGERPLWDFPGETLAGREVAAYLVSEAGGWHMVPPTVFRQAGPAGPGSLQLFVDHNPDFHYFNFTQEERERLRPVALFDIVINNTDRKGGHIFFDDDDHIWLIDHGVCFHVQPKLRTVVWDFANQPIPEGCHQQIQTLKDKLNHGQETRQELSEYLSQQEIQAMISRIDGLLLAGVFPGPSDKRYSYPWPSV